MIVVIDTNVMVQMFGRKPQHSQILNELLRGRLAWALSTEILAEYEETITWRVGSTTWQKVERLITLMGSAHANVVWIHPAFRFQIISADPDDNKFCDCAITAHADYVITGDRHFAPLAGAGYKPQPLTAEEFVQRHLAAG